MFVSQNENNESTSRKASRFDSLQMKPTKSEKADILVVLIRSTQTPQTVQNENITKQKWPMALDTKQAVDLKPVHKATENYYKERGKMSENQKNNQST